MLTQPSPLVLSLSKDEYRRSWFDKRSPHDNRSEPLNTTNRDVMPLKPLEDADVRDASRAAAAERDLIRGRAVCAAAWSVPTNSTNVNEAAANGHTRCARKSLLLGADGRLRYLDYFTCMKSPVREGVQREIPFNACDVRRLAPMVGRRVAIYYTLAAVSIVVWLASAHDRTPSSSPTAPGWC